MMKRLLIVAVAILAAMNMGLAQRGNQIHSSVSPLVQSQNSQSQHVTRAAGDTVLYFGSDGDDIFPTNAMLGIFDVDLAPHSATLQTNGFGVASTWLTAFEEVTPGDTNRYVIISSWHSTAVVADNWLIVGPVEVPAAGADLSWDNFFWDHGFRGAYSVLIDTVGGDPADFASATVLASFTDNDPLTLGDSVWHHRSASVNAYAGDSVYIAIHHTADDQFIAAFDAITLTESAAAGLPHYPIGMVTADADNDGVGDSTGVQCELRGIVHGVDMNSGGAVQFTFIDATGGIGVFSGNDYGYTVAEGDSVHIEGTISAFRGLTQISPDTIIMISGGHALATPMVVTALDETTESELLRINGVTLVDPAQWPAAGSNANVDIKVGLDTLTMRIDRDTDVDGMPVPVGAFDLMGIGGQFTSATPALDGYQILPRYQPDVMPGIVNPAYPAYAIGLVTADADNNGEGDSTGVQCQLRGVVHGVDMNGGGAVQFTFIDATGGIGVFSGNDFGYTVAEGDDVTLQGTISAFRGLTQMTPDTIIMNSAGNALATPMVVTALDETTESELLRINGVTLADPAQWPAAGSNANVDIVVGLDTLTMRIDRDTDVDGMPMPVGAFDLMGIGGQFTSATPALDGYQILPRYQPDVMGSTPAPTYPPYAIGLVTADADNDGVGDSTGVSCELRGIVHGVDMRGGSGVQFTFIDATGGIGLFSGSANFGYTVAEGDEVVVQGTIGAFRGLTQISPDTIWMTSAGNALNTAAVVTALSEATESELVKMECFRLVDTTQWNMGSSFNAMITNVTDTFAMRIDSDVDLSNTTAPLGWFDVTGLGGQFSTATPALGGYQLLPRYTADIVALPSPTVAFAKALDSLDENSGTITVQVDQMNGNPDVTMVTIELDAANSTATEGTDFAFSTTVLDLTGKGMTNNTFDITVTDDVVFEGDETVILDITTVTNAGTATVSQMTIIIKDNEVSAIANLLPADAIKLFPNPVQDIFNLETSLKIESIIITDMQGREIKRFAQSSSVASYNVADLASGTYSLHVTTAKGVWVTKWVKF